MTLLLRRLLALIPTLLGVTLLTFFLMKLTPGDPVRMIAGAEASPEDLERLRHKPVGVVQARRLRLQCRDMTPARIERATLWAAPLQKKG